MAKRLFQLATFGLFQVLVVYQAVGQSREHLDSLNALAKGYACREITKSDSIADQVIQQAKPKHPLPLAYALKVKGQNRICSGEFPLAILLLKQSVALFKKHTDSKGEAEAYGNLTASHRSLSQLDSAKMYNKLHLGIAIELKDSVLLMAGYQLKCGIHTLLAENDSVIFYAVRGLELVEQTKDRRYEGNLLTSIGNAYYQNEDYKPALDYYLRASRVSTIAINKQTLNLLYHNIASCKTKLSQLDSAVIYFEKAILLSKELNNKYNLAYNYQGIADAFFNKADYEKAIQYNLLSKALSEELKEKRSLATVLSNLSACYTRIKKPTLAITSAKQAILIDQEIGDLDKEADAHWLLSEAYTNAGDYKSAMQSFKQFYSIDSAILNGEKSKAMFELETKYQTEKKDLEIANLAQQASIKDLEIKQKNQALIIGFVSVLLIAGFIYFIYRQRSLETKQMQTALEQRFLRSQLNPHFISNALMAVQNFMLKNQAEKAAIYLAKFAKLMREILENSRKEFIPVEDEIQMLTNYLDIHRVRMNEAFDYVIEVDESIDREADAIPPMFVQPFIENAIEHGVINAKARGMIKLKLVKAGEYIAIEITDNGGGLTQPIEDHKGHISLSTTIIQERMASFNKSLKNKIELVLGNIVNENGDVGGTKVELKVPYSYL
jgi:tetratricopeptide (TPR) repeat protein